MYDDFIEELEQIAVQHNKKGMRYFLNSHLSKESIDFLTDAFNGKFKTYTKEDWDRTLKLAETNRGIRQLIPSQSVPKEIFMKFAPKLDDYSNCLRRTDLTETEISNFLKILGAEKVKEMIVEDPSAFSDSVRSYFIHLYPDELKRYDYLPFRLMHRGVQGFDDIENNYDQLYPNNEDAWTEIMNNRFIMEKTKREIFQQGCNIEKLINPPRGEIAHSVYESLAQTIFEFDVDENMDAFKKAEGKLIDLLDKDTLSYSCQMDIIERYKEKPHWAYNRIMKKLAQSSKIDEVLAEIASFSLGSPDINEAVTYNTYSGNDTYKVLVDRAKSIQSKKALFIQFLSHKPDGRPLSRDVMKEASDWGDKNLNKYIVLDHHRFLTKPMEGKTGAYDFYFQFALMVRNELKHKPRAEIFTTSLLLCDKEFNLQHIRNNKIVDKEYCFFMNEFDLKNLISTKYGELGCIERHEKEAMDKIIEKCKDIIQGNTLSSEDEKKNQLDTLFNYKIKIEKIWEQEKLRRNFSKLFMEAKMDGSSGAKEAFRFNMYEVVKAPKSEIEALNYCISKLDDKEFVEKLKFNLLNDMVESVVKPDASFLLIATHKCYPIYEILNKRLQELSKEVNVEEIEEER